jgi:hypothetical protein
VAGDHLLRDPEFDFYPIEDLDVPPSIEKEIRREMQNARNPISKSGFRKEFMTLPDEAWRAATKIVLHIREGDLPPVAKIWTNNSYRGRSALNSHSLEIIMKTGWCPYVIGRNLPWNIDCSSGVINAALANRHRCGKDPTFDGLGKIESAVPVSD